MMEQRDDGGCHVRGGGGGLYRARIAIDRIEKKTCESRMLEKDGDSDHQHFLLRKPCSTPPGTRG